MGIKRLIPRTSKKTKTPGDAEYIGKKKDHKVEIDLYSFDEKDFSFSTEETLSEMNMTFPKEKIFWLNISGVHNIDLLKRVAQQFDLHKLTVEDIANTTLRPKIEFYKNYIYIVAKMLYLNKAKTELISEQVSFILLENGIITFQEEKKDVFDPVRDRIKENLGQVRHHGSDYLLFALLDSIVDHYFSLIGHFGELLENIDIAITAGDSSHNQKELYFLKRELLILKKPVWPLRELINTLLDSEHSFLQDQVQPYFHDLKDNIFQITEGIEHLRELNTSIIDFSLATMGYKTNEIMKFLTIFASIFIPLTFFAGIYGMNFHYIPELEWKWGYFAFWGISIFIGTGMFFYFKRKKWL